VPALPAWFVRRPDGRFDVHLDPELRTAVAIVVSELAQVLADEPDADELHRLRPPAYPDDPSRDLEYQLLAGEELRSSRRSDIEATVALTDRDDVGEGELWSLMRSLNAVRLAAGTRLGIEDDEHRRPRFGFRLSPAQARDWEIYEISGLLQYAAIQALQGGDLGGGLDGDDGGDGEPVS
jgi:hypothetical protein